MSRPEIIIDRPRESYKFDPTRPSKIPGYKAPNERKIPGQLWYRSPLPEEQIEIIEAFVAITYINNRYSERDPKQEVVRMLNVHPDDVDAAFFSLMDGGELRYGRQFEFVHTAKALTPSRR